MLDWSQHQLEVCGLNRELETTGNLSLTLALATYLCCTGSATGEHKENSLPEGDTVVLVVQSLKVLKNMPCYTL